MRTGRVTTQEALAEFERFAEDVQSSDNRNRATETLDDNAYAIYKVLQGYTDDISTGHAQNFNSIFDQYPDYQWNEQQASQLRRRFYIALRSIVETSKLVETTNALLDLQRV